MAAQPGHVVRRDDGNGTTSPPIEGVMGEIDFNGVLQVWRSGAALVPS